MIMPRQLFTAADIRSVARGQKVSFLMLGVDDIITPEAVDVAREFGVRLDRENPPALTFAVSAPEPAKSLPQQTPLPPLKVVFSDKVVLDPFGEGLAAPGMNVRLKDVITASDGSSMAAGLMALEEGEFPWTLTYDEIDIVLEGELVIKRDDVSVHGKAGDVIFIPKGSSITFGTPQHVRFIYVAFPANWNEMG
jgi:ethanolamine utilization protein EutQ